MQRLKIVIPNKLSELTLKQYKHFMLLDKSVDKKTLMIQTLNIFASGDLSELEKFPLSKIQKPYDRLIELLNREENTLHKQVEINGITYGFHPNLSNLSVGEMADIEMALKDGLWNNIEDVLAVLYRRIAAQYKTPKWVYRIFYWRKWKQKYNNQKKLYRIIDYTGKGNRPQLFLNYFPVDALHGVLVFFLIIESYFLNAIRLYLADQKKKKPSKQAQP